MKNKELTGVLLLVTKEESKSYENSISSKK